MKKVYVIEKSYIEKKGANQSHMDYLGKFETLEEAQKAFSGLSVKDLDDKDIIELLEFDYSPENIEIKDFDINDHSLDDFVLVETHDVIYGKLSGGWIIGEDWINPLYVKDFNDLVRDARMNEGFTQAALAEELGISKNAIEKYEQGTRRPEARILMKLIKVLDLDPEEVEIALDKE